VLALWFSPLWISLNHLHFDIFLIE
jgi:hypothetical protein